jgi:hypothetical protein
LNPSLSRFSRRAISHLAFQIKTRVNLTPAH